MISRDNLQDLYPLSPMQEGMLFHWLVTPDSAAYREQVVYALRGAFDVARFEACWNELVRRHEALRTVFVHDKAARPLQMVLKHVPAQCRVEDLRSLARDAQYASASAVRSDERARGFDLVRVPPSRVAVLQLAQDYFEIVWTFHHIILDGWSVALLMADLLRLYAAGGPMHAPAGAAPVPYSQYIKWLGARDGDSGRRYWREQLDGYAGPASIPSSRPGWSPNEYEAAQQDYAFAPAQTAALERFAREHDVTAGTLVTALWAILLSRYQRPAEGGRHDLAFGLVVSGRPPSLPDANGMVGLFTNTVPLRVRIDEGEPLSAFLARLQADAVAAQEHAYLALADVQTAPGMIDHIVAYENYPRDAAIAASVARAEFGFAIESVAAVAQTPYDLNVVFAPGERLAVAFHFNASRYASQQIDRLFAQLVALASAAMPSPHARIGDLDALPHAERALLRGFTARRAERAGPDTLHETIACRIREMPDAPAIIEEHRVLTYAELGAAASRLAAVLRARLHLAPGARVAVVLERGADLPAAWLAILRAGGVYVPVDPVFPDERIAFMVDDSECALVLTSASRREALQRLVPGVGVYDVQAIAAEAAETAPHDAPSPPCAYIIYTSGSTGRPKGVAVGHAGVLNVMAHLSTLHPVGAGDRVVCFASPSFDASIWECCAALCHGAALVIADRDTVADPARFGAFLRRHSCTVTLLPPSYVRLVHLEDLAALKLLATGGEAISAASAEALSGRVRLVNLYGPTEASILVTAHEIAPTQRYSRSVPIGAPIPNVDALVLDTRGRMAPVGAPGELCVAGVCLALDYVKRPELSAERFPAHPLLPGQRMYRTGDVVRWLDDGTLEFAGRTDDQVKVRGYRIELGEIQARLLSCPRVREAAVVVAQEDDATAALVAYIVPDGDVSAADIRKHLAQALPEYMVPSRLVMLDRLPLTPQGKLDRTALLACATREEIRAVTAPRDALEANLVGLWQAVLGVGAVGIHDNFFDLGGHSLTAVRLAARIRKELKHPLEVRDVFTRPTVAELATVLRGQALADVTPVARVPDAADYEASHAQQRLWLLHHLSGKVAAYNIAGAFALEGPLDAAALERAAAALIARHEALRTTFAQTAGRARQRVHPPPAGPVMERKDVSAAADTARAALALFQDAQSRPFDLERGPLVRMLLVTESPSRHLLAFVLHHIVADEWSVGVMARELAQLYEASAREREAALAALTVQHRDVAAWLNARVLSDDAMYWRRQLGGTLPVLDLPTDRPRPQQRSFRGATHAFTIPDALFRRVSAIARASNATLFMALVAVVKTLLARYSGQRDIIVGYPAAGRDHPDLEGQVGFFVNTVVLRDAVRPDATYSELLDAVRQTVLDGLEHQAYPFDRLVEELGVARDGSRHPIFDVMVAYERPSGDGLQLPGLSVRPVTVDSGTSKFDLLFAFRETATSLEAAIGYSTDLFEPATIERMQRHLITLLTAAMDAPDAALASLQMLTTEERRAADPGRAARVDVDCSESVVSRFESAVAASPDAVAVVCGIEQLTYRQLDARATAIAHALAGSGVGRDPPVGLLIDRSADMLVGMLGILKAGAAYLPLDPALPASRLQAMLADADAPVVVSHSRLASQAAALDARIVWLDSRSDAVRGDRLPAVRGRDLAYVMYTSGSTGRPNGVLVEHRNVLALLDAYARLVPSRATPAGTTLCPFGFDVSVWEIFSCLCSGSALHVLTNEIASDPARLLRYFRDHRITSAYVPPALIEDIADALADGKGAALDRLLVGVEPIRQRSLERLRSAVPGLRIVNGYGPTETTVCATFLLFEGGADSDERTPIGRAARGYEVRLLDAAMEYVPAGMPGEIYIGGAGLARGYVRNAALTAQRFVPDPYAADSGARLYKTGDLARLLPDGNLQFLGRADQQVKVRGFRIEPGEIEAALRRYPAVRDAAVIARDAATGGKQLVAYLAGDVAGAHVPQIRAFLKTRLPDYMVPAAFVMLPVLPRTANGKVDREALPPAPPQNVGRYDGARRVTPTEALLERLWSAVLRVNGVGCEDNFFDLGGHSLLATRLISRIREACGVELPLREFFEAPTVRAVAAHVDAAGFDSATAWARTPIPTVPRGSRLPLSFAQQRLWFLEQLEPGSTYNVPVALELDGALDAARVERALNAVIARHESLRTRFVAVDGTPAQDIAAGRPVSLALHDVSSADRASAEEHVRRYAASLAAQPFDLSADALVRGALLKLAPRRHVLLLVIHHIVVDGWSVNVLMRELCASYIGEALPALTLQYADFAAWQRDARHEQALAAQLDYWRKQLADSPPLLALPTDRPRRADRAKRAGLERFALDAETTSRVQQRARELNATSFMILLAAFDALLARVTGQHDIAVGTPVANRGRAEIEPLIGFFANTVVVRVKVEDDASFADLVCRVREAALGAYAHQDVPFEQVVDALQPERSLGHTPLFQALFLLQNAPLEPVALPGLRIRALEQPATTAKFDLTMALEERDGALAGVIEYDADLFEGATIAALAARFGVLVAAAVAQPALAVSRLPLLTPAQRRAVVEAPSLNMPAASADATVTALVAAQVARTPGAVAVEDGAATLTYAELDARANQLAHHLRALGAGPDVPVGLCVPRSSDMLVALLGIVKSGAGIVPLDPSYPQDRLSFMLRDAAVPLLVQKGMDFGMACVDLDRDRDAIAAHPISPPPVRNGPEDALYLLFTSGSTGMPKGVVIPHRVIANLVAWGQAGQGFEAPARTLQFSPISFDVSFQEIFTCWASGGTLVVIDDDCRRDSSALLAFLRESRIERLFLPFVALQGLAEAASGQPADMLPPALKQVITAGEQLRTTHALVELFTRLGACELHNHYGPTETHVIAAHSLTGLPSTWPALPPIGRAVAGARLYVLDAHGEPVPPGVPGELYAGGVAVARGYVQRPELTAERFVPERFTGEGLMYRTGDLVRLRADGDYEFLGRTDGQLKIRGYRVEPGEVEAVLTRHPDVAHAAVVADDRQRLVAYVVAANETGIDAAVLREHVQGALPGYMVPAGYIALDALPLTASGKLDRRALPAPSFADAAPAALEAPRTPAEQRLAAIWSEVLGVPRMGIHENFFDLGGHSLLATQVISRILRAFGVALPLKKLFEAPTIAQLAATLDTCAAARPVEAITPVAREAEMPCSYAQERLWFLSALEGESATYNMPGALRLTGTLDVAALDSSLREIVRRHEVLRTRLVERGGRVVQIIEDGAGPGLPLVDLSGRPDADREAESRQWVQDFVTQPFDLARELPVRFALLRHRATEHVLLIVMHHVAADGWSLGVLAREAKALYAAYSRGEPSPLPELTIQYADFAAWQRAWLTDEAHRLHRDYWKEQLRGAPMRLDLPMARPRPAVQSFRGATVAFTLDAQTAGQLRDAARRHEVTMYTVLLAAYAAMLHRLSGQDDFVIAAPMASRTRPELEPLIGFFINLLPIRVQLGGRPTFAALTRELQTTVLDAMAHEDLPFEKIVEDYAPERSLAGQTPLSEIVFVLQNWPRAPLHLPGLTIAEEPYESFSSKYDLSMSLDETPEGLFGTLEYATDLFDAATAGQMADEYLRLLRTIIEAPDAQVIEARSHAPSVTSDDFSFQED